MDLNARVVINVDIQKNGRMENCTCRCDKKWSEKSSNVHTSPIKLYKTMCSKLYHDRKMDLFFYFFFCVFSGSGVLPMFYWDSFIFGYRKNKSCWRTASSPAGYILYCNIFIIKPYNIGHTDLDVFVWKSFCHIDIIIQVWQFSMK